MSDNQFKLQINFTKAYQDDEGNHFVEGIASGPEVDLTDERMTLPALKSMVDSLNRRIVEFRSEHSDHWNAELGKIVDLSLTPDNHLFYKAKLDMGFSASRDFWYTVTEKGRKLGVSIAGVAKAGYKYASELGREIYPYVDVDLYEISVTRPAAYQYRFAYAVTISLPRNEGPMKKTPDDVTPVAPAVEQAPGESSLQPDTNLTEDDAPQGGQLPQRAPSLQHGGHRQEEVLREQLALTDQENQEANREGQRSSQMTG